MGLAMGRSVLVLRRRFQSVDMSQQPRHKVVQLQMYLEQFFAFQYPSLAYEQVQRYDEVFWL